MIETTWDQEFSARFRKLSADDKDLWESVIKEELPSCRTVDIKEALKVVLERKRKGEIEYTPTVEDLVRAIKFNWWKKKQALRGYMPEEKCSYCYSGWLDYCVSYRNGKREIGSEKFRTEKWKLTSEVCPCLCSQGDRILKKQYNEKSWEGMQTHAKAVMDWLDSITEESPYDDRVFMINKKEKYIV